MVEVALSGNLDFVPLDEVLRLLTRAEREGSVNVRGDQANGRIFISRHGIGLATTSDDATLRSHLINSGYVDEAYLDGVETGETTLAPLGEDLDGGITALLREMTIESIYQLSHNGTSFEVTEDTSSPYSSPSPFDLESVLEDARRRSDEWEEVSRIVSDLNSNIKMNRDIGDRESVEISREAWKVLSEIGSGASVNTMAGRLGTTEFWTAKVAAAMTEKDLLIVSADTAPVAEAEVAVVAEPAAETDPDESWWQEPEDETAVATDDETSTEVEAEVVEVEEPEEEGNRFFGQFAPKRDKTPQPEEVAETEGPVAEADASEADASDSGEGEVAAEAEPVEEPAAAVGAEMLEDAPLPVADGSLDNVEEDTEAFLEKVFSELESNGQPDDDEGHGLLRRRRMGSVLKELDED
jgi:hypothetical protein